MMRRMRFFCVPADGWAVLAGAGDRGRRNARSGRNIFDRNCHALNPLSDSSIVKGFAHKVNVCVLICVNRATVLLQRFDIFNKIASNNVQDAERRSASQKTLVKFAKMSYYYLRNLMQAQRNACAIKCKRTRRNIMATTQTAPKKKGLINFDLQNWQGSDDRHRLSCRRRV